MVMQDPKYSLNPVMTVGKQIREAYRAHARVSRAQAERRALDVLAAVRIRDPERVYKCYPHEVSGGMGQRVMIAMMLVGDPDILIADEPTSALDVTVQMQVLAILDDLVSERGLGLILISHDLNLVASFCDRVLIMYAGRIVESCPAAELHRRQPSLYPGPARGAAADRGRAAALCPCSAATPPGSTGRSPNPPSAVVASRHGRAPGRAVAARPISDMFDGHGGRQRSVLGPIKQPARSASTRSGRRSRAGWRRRCPGSSASGSPLPAPPSCGRPAPPSTSGAFSSFSRSSPSTSGADAGAERNRLRPRLTGRA